MKRLCSLVIAIAITMVSLSQNFNKNLLMGKLLTGYIGEYEIIMLLEEGIQDSITGCYYYINVNEHNQNKIILLKGTLKGTNINLFESNNDESNNVFKGEFSYGRPMGGIGGLQYNYFVGNWNNNKTKKKYQFYIYPVNLTFMHASIIENSDYFDISYNKPVLQYYPDKIVQQNFNEYITIFMNKRINDFKSNALSEISEIRFSSNKPEIYNYIDTITSFSNSLLFEMGRLIIQVEMSESLSYSKSMRTFRTSVIIKYDLLGDKVVLEENIKLTRDISIR